MKSDTPLERWIKLSTKNLKTNLNPKSERNFWVNPDFIEEISNIKKGEPIPVNQFSDCVTQTYSSSDFLNGIIGYAQKNIPRNKKLFLGINLCPKLMVVQTF